MVPGQAVHSGAEHSGTEQEETKTLDSPKHLQPADHTSSANALAVLLTQISKSHSSLVEDLQKHKQAASQAVHSNANALKSMSTSLAEPETSVKQPASALTDSSSQQQASDDNCKRLSGQPRELLPYQQELVDVILQSENSIVFLPNGMFAMLTSLCMQSIMTLAIHSHQPYVK